ncbi:hypothetical protein MAR_023257 [Mya arenaria]|uniref:Uncharacterized protein n=1 Tax=Mya arenaria TaxID=6604 RepID=A0ABY7DQN8_MYAAR|nr:hypothetical protein MAR_023257 [Mya arenaria]
MTNINYDQNYGIMLEPIFLLCDKKSTAGAPGNGLQSLIRGDGCEGGLLQGGDRQTGVHP